MIFTAKDIVLKDGRTATLRNAVRSDARRMIDYMKITAAETDFLLAYPEERNYTEEYEGNFLDSSVKSENNLMIACVIGGEIAGNCQIVFHDKIKTRHRATVAIALIKKYWGLGIGTAMFEEMIAVARKRGISQLELEYIEGNERARRLYEKMGFVKYGERPDSIRLKDGRSLKEILMFMRL